MHTWRGFGSSPAAPPSPSSPFLTPPRGAPPPPTSTPYESWLPSDGQARGWRVSAAAAAVHSPGSRSPEKASSRSPYGAGGGPGPSGGVLPSSQVSSPGRRGASPGPIARSRRRRLLLAAAAALLAAASLVLFFIKPPPPTARREGAVVAVQGGGLGDTHKAGVLRVFPIEDAIPAADAATTTTAAAAVTGSDGGGEELRGTATEGGTATGTIAAGAADARPQLPETKDEGSTTAAAAATTANPVQQAVVIEGSADPVGSMASSDGEVRPASAPDAVEAPGDVGWKAGQRHDVAGDLWMEHVDAARGKAAGGGEAVPKAKSVTADGGGDSGEVEPSAAVAADRGRGEKEAGGRQGMSALREGQAPAALMHGSHQDDHEPAHDHYHQHQPQQQHAGEEEIIHRQQQEQPRRKRKQRQQQPAGIQREDLYDTRSTKVSKGSTPDLAPPLNVASLSASGDVAAGPPGAALGFGALGRVADEGLRAAGGSRGSANTAADSRGIGGGGGDKAEAEVEADVADVYGSSVTGGGSEALRQAREALARYRGGGIPRIIHQMYGLFDTAPSPGRRDRLIGPNPNPDPKPVTAVPRRRVQQQQQTRRNTQYTQQQQQQQQEGMQVLQGQLRSLQGWSGGPEVSIQSWRRLNPGYTHILWGPGDVDELVEVMFPAFAPAFRSFQRMPVLQADLARYLVVFAFGGVYADTDTLCLRPVDGWTDGLGPNVSAIVGVEADAGAIPNWEKFWGRQLQFCQWTFAAEPAHPLLAQVVFRISQLLEQRPVDQLVADDVIHVTGPSVMSDAVYEYLKSKGRDWHEFEGLTHGTLVGDLLVLPITAFSPGVGHMGAGPVGHPEARVQHLFGGSWRKQGFATPQGSGGNNNNNNIGP